MKRQKTTIFNKCFQCFIFLFDHECFFILFQNIQNRFPLKFCPYKCVVIRPKKCQLKGHIPVLVKLAHMLYVYSFVSACLYVWIFALSKCLCVHFLLFTYIFCFVFLSVFLFSGFDLVCMSFVLS